MTGIPQPMDLLDALSGHMERGRTSSADQPIRLARVDPAYNPFASYPSPTPPARVTFDGEDTLSGKAYPVAQGFIPRAGQRVFMLPIGNGYLISGAVNPKTPQGFWQEPDGSDSGVELGGGSYFDAGDGLYLETDATIQGQLQVAGTVRFGGRQAATGPGAGKVFWGSWAPTTDATGTVTITHGAGFTPVQVVICQWSSGASPTPLNFVLISTSFTSTTFQVRCFSATGAALGAGTVVGVAAFLAA